MSKKLKYKVGDKVIYVGHPKDNFTYIDLIGKEVEITHIDLDVYDYYISHSPVMQRELKDGPKMRNVKKVNKFLGVK